MQQSKSGIHSNNNMFMYEEFEDSKGVIISCKFKDRQYNGQHDKGETMISKTLHWKLHIGQHQPNGIPRVSLGAPEGFQFLLCM
jgi:hypothetical protein